MEEDGGGVSLPKLQKRFSLEHTNLCLKMAAVSRQQFNYAVCHKYLSLAERAINDVCMYVYVFKYNKIHYVMS